MRKYVKDAATGVPPKKADARRASAPSPKGGLVSDEQLDASIYCCGTITAKL